VGAPDTPPLALLPHRNLGVVGSMAAAEGPRKKVIIDTDPGIGP